MPSFTKECPCCKRKCTHKNTTYLGERNVSETGVLHWFNCSCHSTITITGRRLDYSMINTVKRAKSSGFTLNYKTINKIGA